MDVEDAGLVGLSAGQPLDLPDGVTEHFGSILAVGDDAARHHLYGDTDTHTGHLTQLVHGLGQILD